MQPIDDFNLYKILVNHLEYTLSNNNINNPSIIFDIDGTIISDKVFAPESKDDLIMPIYKFFLYCMQLGINIFVVTARPAYQINIEKTVEMLQSIGLIAKEYYFSKIGQNQAIYKNNCRKNILDKGYTTIMSIGDNIWDIGEHGGMGILVNRRNHNLFYDIKLTN